MIGIASRLSMTAGTYTCTTLNIAILVARLYDLYNVHEILLKQDSTVNFSYNFAMYIVLPGVYRSNLLLILYMHTYNTTCIIYLVMFLVRML